MFEFIYKRQINELQKIQTRQHELYEEKKKYEIFPHPSMKSYHPLLENFARADYEDLEEQGLLHIAPLKDGTPIWAVGDWNFDGEPFIANSFYVHGVTEQQCGEYNKDFFSDQDKAVEALKKQLQGGN